ncbi:MAG: hypothetical protein ABL921_28490 [Pirellula sp.]
MMSIKEMHASCGARVFGWRGAWPQPRDISRSSFEDTHGDLEMYLNQ